MMAAIAALNALKAPCEVAVFSDSKYLVDAMTKKWYLKWKVNGWMTAEKQPVKNADLWRQLIEQTERHRIIFLWVKGHAGHMETERCDELAVHACTQKNLPADDGFEREAVAPESSFL